MKKVIVTKKLLIKTAVAAVIAIIFMMLTVDTVDNGTYHIKQAAIFGTMTAKMVPGAYPLLFGSKTVWPKAETYYFTSEKDTKDDDNSDNSIEVRFNDGSLANISGTIRIVLPTDKETAIGLATKDGYREYNSLRDKLIKPILRNALRNSANLMSAKESYATNRSDYINWSWDQIQNGVYQTREIEKKIVDPMSGKKVTKTFKIIKKDENGNILRSKNPLKGTGIILANFEVKQFRYSEAVKNK